MTSKCSKLLFIAVLAMIATAGPFVLGLAGPAAAPAFAMNPEAGLVIGLAGLIVNRSNLTAMFQGFKVIFDQAFKGTTPTWDKIAMLSESSGSEEVYPWLGMTTRFREWLGDRQVQNLKTYDWTVKNKSFENTVGVSRDHIEDDKYGVYKPLVAQLGQDAAEHPDQLVFSLLPAGFATLCYDGQYFFDTDHPVLDAAGNATSVSNFGGGAGTAWYLIDDTRMIKPFIFQKRRDYQFVGMDAPTDEVVFTRKEYRYGVDARVNAAYGLWQLAYASKQTLDATNYGAARAAMMGQLGDNGRPLGLRPSLLVVPPSLEKAAFDVVQAERLANGQDNAYYKSARVLVSPWLS